MADIFDEVEVDADERIHVSLSANIQSFAYTIYLFSPKDGGGWNDGQIIGTGDSAHTQWVGTGAQIEGQLIQFCVAQLGNTPTSQYEIVLRVVAERNGGFKDLYTWRIPPGLQDGGSTCRAVKFK